MFHLLWYMIQNVILRSASELDVSLTGDVTKLIVYNIVCLRETLQILSVSSFYLMLN
jgi:hypothetical protein